MLVRKNLVGQVRARYSCIVMAYGVCHSLEHNDDWKEYPQMRNTPVALPLPGFGNLLLALADQPRSGPVQILFCPLHDPLRLALQ